MEDDQIPKAGDTPPPEPADDDAGKGFGTGGEISDITLEAFKVDDPDEEAAPAEADPGEGFGTGGDVKAPER